jgi:hypothetical protein
MMTRERFEVTPQEVILNFVNGFWIARAIYLAAQLGVADHFEHHQPQTITQLATATETDSRSLYRLLRALASVGIFAEVAEQTFILTPLAATLQSNIPGSTRYAILAQMGDDHSLGWSNGLQSLKTGAIAFDSVTGISLWEYYAQHPEAGKVFSESMSNMGLASAQAVVGSYDFSGLSTIADLGGAQGSLISAIVRANSHLTGVLFDLPEIIKTVQVDQRIQPVAGNFFESVPAGMDAYLMRCILHDWDDEKASTILRNCHQAMPDHGKLLLIESIIPPGNAPSPAKFMDVIMLLMTGGWERTQAEYAALLRSSGFELTRVIPTHSMSSIIEAVKVLD